NYAPPKRTLPKSPFISDKTLKKRWDVVNCHATQDQLLDQHTLEHMTLYQKNIEHFVGTVKVPVGLAGPLRVNGLFASDDYLIPL
ncbi:3-hydroxy-3-methylglutaryl-CoA reductase, partial [Vibrio vulnificus]